MRIITNNHWRVWDDDYTPDWGEDPEPSFEYRGSRYFLSEFTVISSAPRGFAHVSPELKDAGWDGILTDSYFSGVVIGLDPEDSDRFKVGLLLA